MSERENRRASPSGSALPSPLVPHPSLPSPWAEAVDPDHYDRAVSAADEALIRPAIADHVPAADGDRVAAKTCLYTVTPDGDFIIDRMPIMSFTTTDAPFALAARAHLAGRCSQRGGEPPRLLGQ